MQNLQSLFFFHLAPAHFPVKFESQSCVKGTSVTINCRALGENPITIAVMKDRLPLEAHRDHRYSLMSDSTVQSADGSTATIQIAECDRRDGSLFSCVASNQYGSDEYNHQLIVLG